MAENEPTTSAEVAVPASKSGYPIVHDNGPLANFLDTDKFVHIQRVARAFAASEIVPKRYQGREADCMIALELAARLKLHPLMVMQNVYNVQGSPGIQGQMVIAIVNASGFFQGPLTWEYKGSGDSRSCTCSAVRASDGVQISLEITWATVKAEGWLAKTGSKWQTMPDQMFAYRTAAWFARLHCPQIIMGLQTVEEIYDVTPITEFTAIADAPASSTTSKVEGKLAEKRARKAQDDPKADQGAQTPTGTEIVPQAGAGEAEQAPESADTTKPEVSWQAKVADMPLKEAAAWALAEWLKAGFSQEDAESTVGVSYAQWTRVKIMALMESAFKAQAEMARAGM